jgi:hypothetical protein
MKDQADRTKTIAEEARIQAGAAKSAADTARDALQISERAYLAAGIPFLEAGFVNIPILNTGHIPSGKGILIIHEATLIVDPRHLGILTKPAEQHRRSHTVENVPPNLPMSVDVPLPIFSAEEFNGGRQQIVIAGTLTYNDGFAATKDQLWKFCDIGQFSDLSRKVEWMPCDPEDALTRLTYGDHYPQGEYQGTQPTSNPN